MTPQIKVNRLKKIWRFMWLILTLCWKTMFLMRRHHRSTRLAFPHLPQHSPSQFESTETSSTSTDSLSPQVSSSLKESSTAFAFLRSSSDAKSTPASTLAGSSSAYTTSQVIDDVPSNIIMNEGITLSGNDLLIMTPFTTEDEKETHVGERERKRSIRRRQERDGDPRRRETLLGCSRCDQHVRLAGGSFLEVSSYLQGRLMQSSHGGEGGDTRMLILLARED
ncbi:LOW QUALITY PROTEIN: hypothetical protein YC2023_006848 [Brassica napus]